MTRRPGITTTEVLVALFVMALGAIAILTLFPLGMLQMGQALKDDRTSQAASSADGYMRWYWQVNVVETGADATLIAAFDNPPGGGFPPPGAGEASYPVAVDPIGVTVRSGPNATWLGYGTAPQSLPVQVVPRLNLLAAPPAAGVMDTRQAIRTCTLLDGLTYTADGVPNVSTGVVERDMRYNWLWVLQRPPGGGRNHVTLAVVVFDKRGAYASPESIIQYVDRPVNTNPVVLVPGQTGLQLPFDSGVQKGSWVMDATSTGALRHAYFYRVVSATETPGNPMTMDVELDKPVRRIDGGPGGYNATVIVLSNVVEVFEKSPLAPL
jgi:hypothetical protein